MRLWQDLALKVGAVLSQLTEDECLVLCEKGTNHFVQFMNQGATGLRAEAVSNGFLSGRQRWSDGQHAAFVALGWEPPSGSPEEATPLKQPEGSPNYLREFRAPFDAAAAYELYQLIFAPTAGVLKGTTDILWYGHGPLGAVPPAVLVSAPPAKPRISEPADFAATPFLVERYSFAALADLSLFPWQRDRPPLHRESPRLLGVGAPLLTADEIAGGPRSRSYELAGGMDGKELAELPKLPESVDEMKGLAGVVGDSNATLWLGPDASERRFAGDALRGYPLIALATHGFLPGEIRNVPEPALLLALDPAGKDRFDGILTSREIASLQLDADLVILSACNTASGDGRPHGETFTGLSQAFIMAGTRSLMVSHWPVMSGAAVQLSVGTLRRTQRQDMPLARSLQQAMQELRKAGAASAIESHPSFWGPFVIVGDGR